MNGILNLNKPGGMTSHDCVAQLRRATRIKRIGHAGTLDPMATGVLLLCFEQATRMSEYLMGSRKVYRAEITFGITTHSQDSTGEVLQQRDASDVTEAGLRSLLPRFTGDLLQIPPMVSALHHEGQRLYDLARKGVEVERQPRPITVYSLELLSFTPGDPPRAEIEVTCSAGTYIRTLAYDIGEAEGCGAHMSALDRTSIGSFHIRDAVTLEEAERLGRNGELAGKLYPLRKAVENSPLLNLDPEQVQEIRHGRSLPSSEDLEEDEVVGLIGMEGDLIALARHKSHQLRPFKVFLSG